MKTLCVVLENEYQSTNLNIIKIVGIVGNLPIIEIQSLKYAINKISNLI